MKPTSLIALASAALSTLLLVESAQAGPALSWNLSRDTMLNSAVSNPHAGSNTGVNPNGVWSFRTSSTPMPLSAHVLMPTYADPCYSHATDFACWRTSTSYEPNVAVSGINQSIHTAGVVTLHPSPTQTAIVRWTSPVTGSIQMLGRFSHVNTCSDSVRYYVYKNSGLLFSGTLQNLGSGSGKTFYKSLTVNLGYKFSYIVDAGPNGNHYCDSTDLDVLITQQQ